MKEFLLGSIYRCKHLFSGMKEKTPVRPRKVSFESCHCEQAFAEVRHIVAHTSILSLFYFFKLIVMAESYFKVNQSYD